MRKGFTLIELIVVIIIVGILAAIGVSQYVKAVEKGRAAEARQVLGQLRTAEASYNLEYGSYTANMVNLSVGAPTVADPNFYFTYACNVAGLCTATRDITAGSKPPVGPSAYVIQLNTATGVWTNASGY